jgi:predicted dehydrogenase
VEHGINVGVIGLGRAGEKHALTYHRLPFVNLAAICDQDENRLSFYCRKLETKGYRDYRELLSDRSIDAVSIVMPDTLHLDATRAAIENDKHILLEKPIASTIEDARKILDLAEGSKRVFMVAHILRFMAAHSLAQQSVAQGEIGEIVHVSARRNSTLAGAEMYSAHHTDTHIHLMVHDIDYINWITGSRATRVYAKARQLLLKKFNMRDTVLATVEYESGALASIEACWILPGNSPSELDDRMEIVGTNGVLYLDGICKGLEIVSKERILRPDTVAWPTVNDVVGGSIFEEITSFINCVSNNKRPLVGAREGFEALTVADAIDRSIREGREIIL